MLRENVRFLICPHCGGTLRAADGALRCGHGHSFDIARQGYVSLLGGKGRGFPGDTAAMVAARAEFLAAGHFAPIADTVARVGARELARQPEGGDGDRCVVDLGAGTGYYLARVGAELAGHAPGGSGDASIPYGLIAVDVSKHAMRRAARLHPELAAVVGNVRRTIPVASGSAALVIDAFAPREPGEIDRVLAARGSVLVVVPDRHHLVELVRAVGLLDVDEAKQERTQRTFGAAFSLVDEQRVSYEMLLSRADVRRAVHMGPSAWHLESVTTERRLHRLPDPAAVTASVRVLTFRRKEEGQVTGSPA